MTRTCLEKSCFLRFDIEVAAAAAVVVVVVVMHVGATETAVVGDIAAASVVVAAAALVATVVEIALVVVVVTPAVVAVPAVVVVVVRPVAAYSVENFAKRCASVRKAVAVHAGVGRQECPSFLAALCLSVFPAIQICASQTPPSRLL